MGYELDWDEFKKRWGVWSTVVCDFIGYATTPEDVADIITKGKELYYCSMREIGERPMICVYHPSLTTESKPDLKAKEAVKQMWIEEAKKVREEKRRVTLVCELTPEGEIRKLLP